jgi:nucleotide-binding universal stress UspA family protein
VNKILVAYDGSDGAKRALEAVGELRPAGGAVTVLGVAEGVPLFGYAGTLPSPEEEEECRRRLDEAGKALAAQGIVPALVTRRGDPATAILDEAQKEEADLIVIGTRGLSTAERWLVGSVSTKVFHHARCSVLVAR